MEKGIALKGVQFVVDTSGKRTAELKRRVTLAIDALMQNPYPRGFRKLAGHDRLYRVRVG